MDKLELSIIIVDYNASDLIIECIKSILKNIIHTKYEIIVVDNDSGENHLADYEKLGKNIRTLRLKNNKGFGSGNNAGAKIANGEYMFLLNPDTLIVDDSIEKMLSFIKSHNNIGALTCLLYNRDGKLQKGFFGKFQTLFGLTFRHYNYQKVDPSKGFFYTDIVTGAAFLIKKELFERVGGFDEKIFMYLEDDDLCRRIIKLGYKNAVLNTAKIIHFEGQTTTYKEKKKYYYKSQDYYWKKHNGTFGATLMKMIRWPYKKFKS
jgi:hypothetical protein